MSGCPQCDVEHPRGAPDCPAERLGKTLGGRYRVERLLGIGGMGAVYEATHLELGNRVAVKAIRARVAPSPESIERFEREARELAALRHPGIVEVRDLGRDDDGRPFMVMELLEGENLSDRLARGPLAVDQVVRIAIEALSALAEAHARSIVHRDLKPANLFWARAREGERVKVLDFGIAKVVGAQASSLTQTGLMIGSAPYMSPEQTADSKRVDARSDVYAMGATVYELLTGRPSAEGTTTVEVVVKIAKGDVHRHPALLRADVPPWLDAIVAKALATDPARRFGSALEMKRALEQGPGAAVTLAGAPPPPERAAATTPAPPPQVSPVALAVTAPATPTSARPSLPPEERISDPPSRTPEPAVVSPARGARVPRRRAAAAAITIGLVAGAIAIVAPGWWRPEQPASGSGRAAPAGAAATAAPTSANAPSSVAPTNANAPSSETGDRPNTPPRAETAGSPPIVGASGAGAAAPPTRRAGAGEPGPAAAAPPARPGRAVRAPVGAPERAAPRQDADSAAPAAATAQQQPEAPAAPPPRAPAPPVPAQSGPGREPLTFDQEDSPLFPTREEGLPQMPSMREVHQRLIELRPAINRCAPRRMVQVRFQIAGATGMARSIQLEDFEGSMAEGRCVAAAIRAAAFPRFRIMTFPVQWAFPQ